MIDSRAIALEANIALKVGLLEPGNLAALGNQIEKYVVGDVNPYNTTQLLLNTSVEPWVWVKVDVVTQEESAEFQAVWFPADEASKQQ